MAQPTSTGAPLLAENALVDEKKENASDVEMDDVGDNDQVAAGQSINLTGKRKKSEGNLAEMPKIQKVTHPIEPTEAEFREAVEWLKIFEQGHTYTREIKSLFCKNFISVFILFFEAKIISRSDTMMQLQKAKISLETYQNVVFTCIEEIMKTKRCSYKNENGNTKDMSKEEEATAVQSIIEKNLRQPVTVYNFSIWRSKFL